VGAYSGIEQLDGVDPSQLRWVKQYMSLAGGYLVDGYGVTIPYFPHDVQVRSAWRDAVPDASLLGLLNGRFVVAEYPIEAHGLMPVDRTDESYVYENKHVLPRAFSVAYVEQVADWPEAQRRLANGFNPAQGALVEGGGALTGAPGWQAAQVVHMTPNRVIVESLVAEPALLVLSEVWYPGWQVTVDGIQQPIYRVDGIVRGVYLDPGQHVVDWRYRPRSLLWGTCITLGTLLGLFAMGVTRRFRRKR
jgi:uncharacterized membrane protein YfhO